MKKREKLTSLGVARRRRRQCPSPIDERLARKRLAFPARQEHAVGGVVDRDAPVEQLFSRRLGLIVFQGYDVAGARVDWAG